jgi:DNA mismatch endonuclease, patch repair protein
MSQIRGKNTKAEVFVRSGLFALGFRYRLHRRDLPGSPDVVLPKHHAVIFIHGCFWHGHKCHLFKVPGTHTDFWLKKIAGNVDRDRKTVAALQQDGWRVLTIWECALRGRQQRSLNEVLRKAESFLRGKRNLLQVMGRRADSASD